MKIYMYKEKDLNMVNITSLVYGVVIGLIVLVGSSFLISREVVKEVELLPSEIETVIIKERDKFSEELLLEYIFELNLKFPEIVFAQAKLESGNFSSPIFKENHNLFGMKMAKTRPTTAKGVRRNHAYYNNWRASVLDYALYQAAFLRKIQTEDEYYQYIGSSYAEDPNYVNKVKKISSECCTSGN